MLTSSRNYLSAIETLNQLQTSQGNVLKNGVKLKAMIKYLYRCGITLEKLDGLAVIHVTGTHGKGSTCVYTENVLLNHGFKTGFYSSPHVLEVRERIRVDGKPISKNNFAEHFWKIYDMLERHKENVCDIPLYFPLLTILAFHVFLESNVDVAIIEVGTGGEYDCTNIIRRPIVVGVSPINIDHTSILGASVESIAWHKGGIMKEGCVAYSVEQPEAALAILLERSRERKCSLEVVRNDLFADNDNSKIPSHVKRTNASLAIALSQAFMQKVYIPGKTKEFSLEIATRAVEEAFWPGRYQVKQVKGIRFFLEGAHTIESLRTCSTWFKNQTKGSHAEKVLIFNLTGGRDAEVFLKELLPCQFDVAIFTPNVGRDENSADTVNFKLTTDKQLELCGKYRRIWSELIRNSGGNSRTFVFSSFSQALGCLDNGSEYDTLVTGSLYLVGAGLSVLDPSLNGILEE